MKPIDLYCKDLHGRATSGGQLRCAAILHLHFAVSGFQSINSVRRKVSRTHRSTATPPLQVCIMTPPLPAVHAVRARKRPGRPSKMTAAARDAKQLAVGKRKRATTCKPAAPLVNGQACTQCATHVGLSLGPEKFFLFLCLDCHAAWQQVKTNTSICCASHAGYKGLMGHLGYQDLQAST